ncbi:MAG: glycosyltransferase family 4 protein [Oscillospiraceae bacterium]|nr:glycosyltransferase family 4 protein [Oscillospiraceae bacterium]
MAEDIFKLSQLVEDLLENERPLTVLEVSGFEEDYGRLISSWHEKAISDGLPVGDMRFDRVDLSDGSLAAENNIYDNIYNTDYIINIDKMDDYDVILIFHLLENMIDVDARALLESLLVKVNKQIFVITPIYPYDLSSVSEDGLSNVRAYHPVFFLGMDFSYRMLDTTEGRLQAYSFFPSMGYSELPCDLLPEAPGMARMLKIAYVLPHQCLTGGLKALLQQMKELTKRGHSVFTFLRSDKCDRVLPAWSHLTDDDVAAQIVIPESAGYLDYISDVDIIISGWVDQSKELSESRIPVVMWEQGSEFFYGEHKKPQYSGTEERLIIHRLYRTPVHLLAVSETIKTVLKGIYNRESQLFPNGIDTDFYYPLKQKNNAVPTVLLVGNPYLEFKGFDFAISLLNAAQELGLKFNIWWASQADFSLKQDSLGVEKYIEPSQYKLAELYRNADVFISASLYESFPLPPLEAMASGTAVIATNSGGINTYAKPGVNCLLCEQGDFESMLFALLHLLTNPKARDSLAAEGRKTALEYSFSNVIPILEQCLTRIVVNEINNYTANSFNI